MNSALDSNGAANTIGNMITAVDVLLDKEKPDALLVLGDTNSCLSGYSSETAQNTNLSHGGRKSLLRSEGSRRLIAELSIIPRISI